MIGVAGQAVADQFGIDLGATRLGVFEFFQDHHAGALAHHEAVAIFVVGARGALPGVIVAGGQRVQRREARRRPIPQTAASVPPATITSASPYWMIRTESPSE